MGTTREQIRGWLERGVVADGATHMVVACDTFDWEDYLVYMSPGGVGRGGRRGPPRGGHAAQLAEARAWHGWRPGQGAT